MSDPGVVPGAAVPTYSDRRHLKRWGVGVCAPIAVLAAVVPVLVVVDGGSARLALGIGLGLAALLGVVVAAILLGTRLPRAG